MGTRSEVQHQHGETLQTLTDHKAKSLELLKDPPQIHIDYREDKPYCFCFFFLFFQYIFLLAAFSASAFLLLLASLISIYHQTVASATTQIVLKNVKKLFIHHYTIIQSFILGPRSLHVSLSCCPDVDASRRCRPCDLCKFCFIIKSLVGVTLFLTNPSFHP